MPLTGTANQYEHITGYWQWSLTERERYYNPLLKKMLGYAPDDFADEIEQWKKLVFPTDFGDLLIIVKKHLDSRGEIPFAHELRFFHKDGSTVFILFSGRVISFTDEGKPEKMYGTHINLTVQKLAARDLLRTRDFLKRTSEVARVGGWELDVVNGKVVWSDVTKHIFGVPNDFEPAYGSTSSFFKPGFNRDKLLQAAKNAIENGAPYDLELQIINNVGQERWTRTIGQPEFENGRCVRMYGIFQDITERKEQEEAIRQKQVQLENFIWHSPVAIAMMDRAFNYMAVSKIWMASYKLDAATLIGRNHFEVFPEIPEKWIDCLNRCLNGEVIKKEEDNFHRMDGREEWLRWEIRPWYISPGVAGGVTMFTELVTEKRQAREAIIKAKEQAEQAAQTKALFLSVMSHEMRTPMNGVIGFTNLLLKNPRKDQREALNVLKFSAQNLMSIINDVLDLSKIEEGKVQLEDVDFDMHELLNNICRTQEQQAKEKNIALNLFIGPMLPKWVKGDPLRIGQIITNLVNNAIKFTPAGKVDVTVNLNEYRGEKALLDFAVADTGIGIPNEKQASIFEMFTQAEAETSRFYGGTGLGLTITRRLLQLMGSNVYVKSTLGDGSLFYFEIELAKGKQPHQDQQKNSPEAASAPLKDVNVLIVDDNPINVLVAKRFLQQWKANYDTAEDGKIALDKIKATDYDIVLMDLKMPVMDGYQATIEVRKLDGEKYKKLPIIALTASALDEMRGSIIESGLNDFIIKPFNPDELLARIQQYVRK